MTNILFKPHEIHNITTFLYKNARKDNNVKISDNYHSQASRFIWQSFIAYHINLVSFILYKMKAFAIYHIMMDANLQNEILFVSWRDTKFGLLISYIHPKI